MAGFSAIFQVMRADQTGGTPNIRELYRGGLRRVKPVAYRL